MATYQSLYRRYRPQRFDEVLGQDHVTKALRNAVRDGRVGHAYLFSGPRGTGKTSTARILAKVLNCAAPVGGEPCGVCENCRAVAGGRIIDWLLEQDAASKSKVDDMRDLLERVPLGTSGNRKVIILDEVHMLTQGAENALLKTLEEPPSHVVFVLATTDPQKVRPTIRSRTQHFEFRLLPPDVLADHVRHVIDHAGLALDAAAVEQAVDHVLRSGGGSARDTLSALDQVAALGEVVDERHPVEAILDALSDREAGRVLVAVADALASGRDPRSLGETLIAALRDAFLSLMGAGDDHLPPAERERAARLGERLGAPGLTRALDVLGEALTELSRKPDPRVVVEVALVRLTQPAADRTLDAVLERLDRLERAVATGTVAAGGAGPPSGSIPAPGTGPGPGPAPAEGRGGTGATDRRAGTGSAAARDALSSARDARGSDDPPPTAPGTGGGASSKPTLGAVARGRRGAPARASATSSPPEAPSPGSVALQDAPAPAAADGAGPAELPSVTDVEAAWSSAVLASLPVKIRSKWRGGRWTGPAGGALRFVVPNAWHQNACDEARHEVERALGGHFGRPIAVAVVVEGDDGSASGASPGPSAGALPAPGGAVADPGDEHIDPTELRDADGVATGGVDMLLREFGGGQVVEEEP